MGVYMQHLQPIDDPAHWHGADLSNTSQWLFMLSQAEIDALLALAARIKPTLKGDPNALLSQSNGPIEFGAARPLLDRLYATLKSGLGVALVRGLPIADIDPLDAAIIYWAVGSHLGTATPNNP